MATAISGTTGTTATTGTATSKQPASLTQGAGGALGKDQFLKLLVAQLKNQDPQNPMDSSQMAAQLAQFSSVEQLTQINETLSTQNTGQSSLAQLMAENGALASVGKTVVASASAVDVSGGVPQSIAVDLPVGTKSATLKIYDSKGAVVAEQPLNVTDDGRQTFTLSGGAAKLTAGTYKYDVETTGTSGDVTSAPTYIAGKVTGVRYTSSGPVVTVGGALVPYMSVTEITQ